ncbi:hypothetical protein A2Y83_03215 [Candidatus Falkowbacteria bacterium RBG_13_39_14]|uniref:Uncharacterized protein n=1 Tax=Candidatus Falkowbacteria bacterium RBG_13_39_14 TaxID=1797985 RepID=A0A1F5S5M8_9BACT|nr:MAG: hypothetical protein A2Y83_03215 [Candidatus Falkowbacteria bacterium RBG_13_39_14]
MKPPEMDMGSPEQTETKKHTIELKDGESITIEETKPGTFRIIDNSITKKDKHIMDGETSLGIKKSNEEVKYLDNDDSDARVFSDSSEHLKWEDVEFSYTGLEWEIKAPSLERVKEALEHTEMIAYNPEDS